MAPLRFIIVLHLLGTAMAFGWTGRLCDKGTQDTTVTSAEAPSCAFAAEVDLFFAVGQVVFAPAIAEVDASIDFVRLPNYTRDRDVVQNLQRTADAMRANAGDVDQLFEAIFVLNARLRALARLDHSPICALPAVDGALPICPYAVKLSSSMDVVMAQLPKAQAAVERYLDYRSYVCARVFQGFGLFEFALGLLFGIEYQFPEICQKCRRIIILEHALERVAVAFGDAAIGGAQQVTYLGEDVADIVSIIGHLAY